MLSGKSAESSEVNKTSSEAPSDKAEETNFFESQLFRWISVFLYLGGISGLGCVLSLYYLMFFDSRMPEMHLRFPISVDGIPLQKLQEVKG